MSWPAVDARRQEAPMILAAWAATGSMETRPMSAAEAPDIRSARSICSFRVLGSRIALENSDSRFNGGRNSFDSRLLDEPK